MSKTKSRVALVQQMENQKLRQYSDVKYKTGSREVSPQPMGEFNASSKLKNFETAARSTCMSSLKKTY